MIDVCLAYIYESIFTSLPESGFKWYLSKGKLHSIKEIQQYRDWNGFHGDVRLTLVLWIATANHRVPTWNETWHQRQGQDRVVAMLCSQPPNGSVFDSLMSTACHVWAFVSGMPHNPCFDNHYLRLNSLWDTLTKCVYSSSVYRSSVWSSNTWCGMFSLWDTLTKCAQTLFINESCPRARFSDVFRATQNEM